MSAGVDSSEAPPARQDVRHFLHDYELAHADDLLRIDEPVAANQGVTAIVQELAAAGRAPLLLCSAVQGLGATVATNMFASRERVARMLATTPGELHRAFAAAGARRVPVRDLGDGPVLAVQQGDTELDLGTLPMLTHFAEDRGPYWTSAIILADDPRTGIGNASYHRAMLAGRASLATSLHSRGHLWTYLAAARERGASLPVAVVIGGHPLFMLACAARAGIDVDEREIAGGLFGEPLEVVRTPELGIAVPASAEIVLEGTIEPDEHAEEGPFGEYSGYASARSTNNLVRVCRVLRRRDPVLVDVVSGNAADHLNLGRIPRESDLAAKIWERFPSVVAIEYPSSGTHFHCYVALRQVVPGLARQVILALLGLDPYLKLVVAVDDDIDVSREAEVLWAVATRAQADADVIVVPRVPGSLLDPSSDHGLTARMGIDATRGPGFDAQRISLSDAAVARARELVAGSR